MPVGELVAGRRVWNPGGDGQHLAQELSPAVVLRKIDPFRGLIEQVLQIRPRGLEPIAIGVRAVSPDERVRVLALVEGQNVDVEAFGHEQFARPGRRTLTRGVRIEAQHHARGEPANQLSLPRVNAVPQEATTGAACV